MKNNIKARSSFNSHIENNPVELLKAIKEHALNYQESWYAMLIILDAMRMMLGSKQQEGESLQDDTKRFRVAKDVLESHVGGPIQFPKIVEALLHMMQRSKQLSKRGTSKGRLISLWRSFTLTRLTKPSTDRSWPGWTRRSCWVMINTLNLEPKLTMC